MPLFDLSYQRYEGDRTSRSARIAALSFSTARLMLQERKFLALLMLCWIPVIVHAVFIYIARQVPQWQFQPIDASFWQSFLTRQVTLSCFLLVSLYTGASAIAQDLRTGALVLYLSKPFSRVHYLVAKTLPVVVTLLAISVVPAFVLLALHLSFAGELSLLRESPMLPLSILVYGTWLSVYFGSIVLAMSSLARSGRLAGAGVVMVVMGSYFLQMTLQSLGLDTTFWRLSLIHHAWDVGYFFFGNLESGQAPINSFVATSVVIVFSIAMILRRLRTVEVST